MTFSILALDPETGAIGGAAATGNLAVGGWVLRAAARAGAVATQGFAVSPLWGDEALARLAKGETADAIVDALVKADPGRDHRQLSVLDAKGGTAAWTGSANMQNNYHLLGQGRVVAGNWLSNPDVLKNVDAGFEAARHAGEAGFGQRLLDGLQAGFEAGSDARGTFSAAIRIVRADRPPLDLRVDYDEGGPIARLRALYDKATSPPYSEWALEVPTLEDPYRC